MRSAHRSSTSTRVVFAILRAVAAVVYAAAVVAQLLHSIGFWSAQEGADIPFLVLGFFSYFTMETGIAASVVLAVGAVLLATRGTTRGWFTVARGLVLTYAATTALAYNVLLRPIEVADGSAVPWSNEWLHVYGPAYLMLDWVLGPDRRPLRWGALWIAVGIPLTWAAYTFARGPTALDTRTDTNWYPYPFLNPDTSPGGYGSAVVYVAVLAALILAIATVVILLSRVGRAPDAERSDPDALAAPLPPRRNGHIRSDGTKLGRGAGS